MDFVALIPDVYSRETILATVGASKMYSSPERQDSIGS